ncbi:MAG: hypothetical protein ACXAC5_02895 [Promethearchaeota archaeon]|jgi:hypothetical protein
MTKYCYATTWRIVVKQKLLKLKGGKCEKCGYDKDIPGSFVFHHREPKKKDFGIGQYAKLNWQKILAEVKKCDLLCQNCHAEVHDDPEKRKEILRLHKKRQRRKLSIVKCQFCHKEFKEIKYAQKYCSPKCSAKGRQKVKRPTKPQLARILAKKSFSAVGRDMNVSDNAVRKWAKAYELL